MRPLIFEHRIEKKQEGTYYSVPFTVPDGICSLTVSYRYPKTAPPGQPDNVVDIGLEDETGQFLGWSGSARPTVTVGEFDATPGYPMQPVRSGTWHILIGAYHIPPDGLSVQFSVAFEQKKSAWLFGDFHVHSDASDGQFDIPTLARMAKKRGLDFLSVTNHNNYAENFSLPHVPGLTLIPGVEWTHYLGHMNFFGIPNPFSGSFIANDLKQMQRIVQEARQRGAVISVNHPKCTLCPYLWPDDQSFRMIEIWNGPMRSVNTNAIAWWTGLLSLGRRIPAVGGSDYHRAHSPVRLGNPVTAVFSPSRSAHDILDAAAHGHSYITSGVNGVRLALDCGQKSFGDTVTVSSEPPAITVSAEHMPPGSVLQIIGDYGIILSKLQPHHGSVCRTLHLPRTGFIYLQAVQMLPGKRCYPLAVSNPLYLEYFSSAGV